MPHALTDAGEANLALKVITQTTYPSWGYWLSKGATTQWEDWKGEWSLNHIMFGDMSSWFYKTLTGIRLDNNVPGFKHFIIKTEHTETLQWAKGKYESAYGTLSSEWKNENGRFVHDIEVPANTTATYYTPTAKAANLKESGKTIASQGIRIAATEQGRVVLELEPGRYHFEMPAK